MALLTLLVEPAVVAGGGRPPLAVPPPPSALPAPARGSGPRRRAPERRYGRDPVPARRGRGGGRRPLGGPRADGGGGLGREGRPRPRSRVAAPRAPRRRRRRAPRAGGRVPRGGRRRGRGGGAPRAAATGGCCGSPWVNFFLCWYGSSVGCPSPSPRFPLGSADGSLFGTLTTLPPPSSDRSGLLEDRRNSPPWPERAFGLSPGERALVADPPPPPPPPFPTKTSEPPPSSSES